MQIRSNVKWRIYARYYDDMYETKNKRNREGAVEREIDKAKTGQVEKESNLC